MSGATEKAVFAVEAVSGLSWGGFDVSGDYRSIDEVGRLLHVSGRAAALEGVLRAERTARETLERELAAVDAFLAMHAGAIDRNPREQWPEGSVLERAIARHEARFKL